MKRTLSALLVLPLLCGLLVAIPSFVPAAAAPAIDEEGPLHEAMESLQSSLRQLGKLLADPANAAEAAGLARAMQDHAVAAFQHPPAAPEGVTAESFALDFRTELHGVLGELLALERTLRAGDVEAAKQRFQALNALKKAGHDRFRVDD